MKFDRKKIWYTFTDRFGNTPIHPQYIALRSNKVTLDQATKYAHGKLLDVGCGRMPYKKDLQHRVEQYIGVDHPSASKLYISTNKPDYYADATKLPFASNTFDIVLLLEVLPYVEEPQKALEEIQRVLKKNGILILSSTFLYPITDPTYDRYRFTMVALQEMLNKSSFRIISLQEKGSFSEFWILSLNTYLFKKINESIKHKKNTNNILIAVILLFVSPIIILFGNFFIYILDDFKHKGSRVNYFPIRIFAVGKKK